MCQLGVPRVFLIDRLDCSVSDELWWTQALVLSLGTQAGLRPGDIGELWLWGSGAISGLR